MSARRRLVEALNVDGREDRGIILPLTAIMLVILVGFVAFAVDLGVLYNERRQDQSAVDVGALSGARVMIDGESNDAIFEDVVALTYENLWSPNFSLEAWYGMWDTCTDTGAAASGFGDPLELSSGYVSPGGTVFADETVECVTFDDAADPGRMRVHLPVINVDAVFAAVLGIDGWPSSAFAEVGISNPRDVGGVLPFGLPLGSTGYAEVCIKASSQSPSVCDGGTTGNYGPLDLSVFGLAAGAKNCAGTGSSADRTAVNTAQGLDHMLSTTDGDPPTVPVFTDQGECTSAQDDDPNSADTDTGVDTNGFYLGMLGSTGETKSGVSLPAGVEGRLRGIHPRLDAAYQPSTTNTVVVQPGREIEDVPLWAFLDDSLVPGIDPSTTVPIRCLPEVFDTFDTKAELEDTLDDFFGFTSAQFGVWTSSLSYPVDLATSQNLRDCFNDYNTGLLVPGVPPNGAPYESVLFGKDSITGDDYVDGDGVSHQVYDIEYSDRFGWMPVIWNNTFPNGSKQVYFKTFQPVFINTIFAKCQGNGSCNFIHSPGEGITGSAMAANDKLDAATGFSIQLPMLPLEVQDAMQQNLTDVPPVQLLR